MCFPKSLESNVVYGGGEMILLRRSARIPSIELSILTVVECGRTADYARRSVQRLILVSTGRRPLVNRARKQQTDGFLDKQPDQNAK